MSDRLNLLAVVIAELMFDLFEGLTHGFGYAQTSEGNGDETDCCEDDEGHLQAKVGKQRREYQTDDEVFEKITKHTIKNSV